jgi:hypothetical protein
MFSCEAKHSLTLYKTVCWHKTRYTSSLLLCRSLSLTHPHTHTHTHSTFEISPSLWNADILNMKCNLLDLYSEKRALTLDEFAEIWWGIILKTIIYAILSLTQYSHVYSNFVQSLPSVKQKTICVGQSHWFSCPCNVRTHRIHVQKEEHNQKMFLLLLLLPEHYSPLWSLASNTISSISDGQTSVRLEFQLYRLNKFVFTGFRCQPNAQPPIWRTKVFLLVWNLTLDLSGLGDPASSYATAGIALQIIGARKPHRRGETFSLPPGMSSEGRCATKRISQSMAPDLTGF